MSLVSVIVPAYNAEKVIGRCVESILSQNYSAFEIVLVNDGSKDRTRAICDDYAKKDSRVRVIHKENSGVSAARNSGLEIAKGEWVTFVDSDDFVQPSYLFDMMVAVEPEIDIIVAGYVVRRFGSRIRKGNTPVSTIVDDFDTALDKNYIHTAPWAKMFRMAFIRENNMHFPEEISMGEDVVFVCDCIGLSQNIKIIDSCEYVYDNEPLASALTQKFYALEKELYISERVNRSVDKMRYNKQIHSVGAIRNLNDIKSIYRYRVLNTLYGGCERPRVERLEILQKIEPESLWRYNLKKDGFRLWLASNLLHHRLLSLYDFLRIAARRGRKG